MTFAWGETASIWGGISFGVHLWNGVCSADRENWIDQEDKGKKKERVK
jgi:hypothetical protein